MDGERFDAVARAWGRVARPGAAPAVFVFVLALDGPR